MGEYFIEDMNESDDFNDDSKSKITSKNTPRDNSKSRIKDNKIKKNMGRIVKRRDGINSFG